LVPEGGPTKGLSEAGKVKGRSPADFVVRINVNVIQVDAVVTDSKGHKVTGLKAEDFEVFQNGVPQRITNFNYVENGIKPTASSVRWAPRVPLKPGQVRRTIVLVVDDLGMSFEGMAYVRGSSSLPTDDCFTRQSITSKSAFLAGRQASYRWTRANVRKPECRAYLFG
jgi:hypothetical protein